MLNNLIFILLGIIIGYFFLPFKSFFYDRYTKQCSFFPPGGSGARPQPINITKIFGKVTHIDCPWWDKREKIVFNSNTYWYCGFGYHIKNGLKGRTRKCPFV